MFKFLVCLHGEYQIKISFRGNTTNKFINLLVVTKTNNFVNSS